MIGYLKEKQKEHFFKHGVRVHVKDELEADISVQAVIDKVLNTLPHHLFDDIQSIKIGDFYELKDRKLQAMYKDGIIYLTNNRETERGMVSDIIHELAHSIEETHSRIIFGDNKIIDEFLIKRRKMQKILDKKGFKKSDKFYKNVKYSESFDMFLYKEVGYTNLRALTANLFYSPYAATSLREYFANAFEKYFMHEAPPRLKTISPEAYNKVVLISQNKKKGENYDL